MTFEDVIADIEKLVGLELKSIRSGANIKVLELDRRAERWTVMTSKLKERSRPFSELERIWKALCQQETAHVDSVLGGSGSSRNQPETVLANLPYVEFLFLDGKKHLACIGKPSHPLGTLKKMDEMAAEQIKSSIKNSQRELQRYQAASMIVSRNIAAHAEYFEKLSGMAGSAIEQGIYEFNLPSTKVVLVSDNVAPESLQVGTYLVLPCNSSEYPGERIEIGGQIYNLYSGDGLFTLTY